MSEPRNDLPQTWSGQGIGWIMDKLFALATPAWAYGPTMQAVRNGFLLCLPLVVAGALAVLMSNLPVQVYQDAMRTLFGAQWKQFLGLVWQGSFGILSLPMVFGVCCNLVLDHNQRRPLAPVNPVTAGIVALASFAVLLPSDDFVAQLGVPGLFVGILASVTATRIFLRLVRVRFLQMRIYPDGIVQVSQAFSCLAAGVLTVMLFAGVNLGARALTGVSVHECIHGLLLFPFRLDMLQNMLDTGIAYVFITHVCWFFGLHGTNVFDPLTRDIFEAATQGNLAAQAQGLPPPHIITKHFLDTFVFMGGAGASVCLLLAIFAISRDGGNRRLARVSLVPGMFNINEIVLFGLPIVLNPIYFIPFLLVPMALTLTSFTAIRYGLAPPPLTALDWTTPPLLGGYFSTGHIAGSLLQIFNIILGTLIYMPFVSVSDRIKEERQKRAKRDLLEIACSNAVGPSGKKCLDRDDEVGALARILARDLEVALKTGAGVYLEYQPQVDGSAGRVVGAEALVRWRHPVYGLIPAPIIVAISEDADFMRDLGFRVLNEACAERARWHAAGLDTCFKMAVNVSIRQLDDVTLPGRLAQCLEKHGLTRKMIGIEVTESTALDPDAPHNLILGQIHDLGFSISIDDFGMGHSSLVYLKYFPVDTLKIDKALSKDVASSQICVEIIATIVDLCRALDTRIVVEFVETQEQIDVLDRLGCHIFQGYFYSPPLPGEKMLEYALRMNGRSRDSGDGERQDGARA
ncbi:MAG: EAL domain-containing protein [Zoogloeaceae bacterium]|jgi:lactose/cellobiose-specific phosphotransferase system IIC component|nr:EAL domain-containing protein [Zoogloeaceae bacterium]